MNKPEIIKKDPWLEPYTGSVQKRIERFKSEKERLDETPGSSLAHQYYGDHVKGGNVIIREWAPNAQAIYLLCDRTLWSISEEYKFTRLNEYGDWEITVAPSVLSHGSHYRIFVKWKGGEGERIPAYARRVYQDPETYIFTAQIWNPEKKYRWKKTRPVSIKNADFVPVIYEAHIGMSLEQGGVGTFSYFKDKVLPRIADDGFNTIQFMALMEHPYYASFGYQVSSFFALTHRYGTPEEFKELVDECHSRDIRVIMDLVHSHAVKNELEGIGYQDGSDYLYFHSGEAGNHPAWDSRCFNYGKHETINFLLSNCRFWLEEYKLDGFRFDGVTSMLYRDHGLGASFDNYEKYFNENVDEDAVLYLTLANDLIHRLNPDAVTIAEDMSGLPGTGAAPEDGGLGFNYRLTMGLPDYWIKIIKEKKDEDWNVSEIWNVLNNRRYGEKHIAYSESHDQALVGDKAILFRLMDAAMYTDMRIDCESLIADRGTAYYRLINFLTFNAGGDGYLCFMGNEFGHPEWIDFPREGNGWSYHYARRQWSLSVNPELRYSRLRLFTSELIKKCGAMLHTGCARLTHCHDSDGVLAFCRDNYMFAVNINPKISFTDYGLAAAQGEWEMILNTDDKRFDGHGRLPENLELLSEKDADGEYRLKVYLPSKTAVVFRRKKI